MKGVVRGTSKSGVRVAVLTEYGYTVFDIVAGDTFVGDVLIGNLDDHGDSVLTSETSGRKLDVYIEAIHATPESAQSLLARI